MTIIARRRSRAGHRPGVRERVIGNATVVHLPERISDEAAALAMRVARDPQHQLVVVDLPTGSPAGLWEEVAGRLPRRGRGIRLVVGGRTRETTTLAGQWLAERLGRSVVAPDGAVHPGADGSLFVHSGRGTGWVRFRPGRAPRWESKRFPKPRWDCEAFAEDWPTGPRAMAEPIPGGMWIRPVGHEPWQRPHRQRLVETVPCQPDLVTVVVGCPGSPPLPLDDIARLWVRLPQPLRRRVRFAQFGPVATGAVGVPALGQALADRLGERVACYTGLPVGSGAEPDVHTVDNRGNLVWNALARAVGYTPGGDRPVLLDHRCPVPGLPEITRGVYWYAPDAVIEVVQSGLWIRPPVEGPHAAAVRCLPPDPPAHNVLFDAGPDADRMCQLAHEVTACLHPSTRHASRVLPATGDQLTITGPVTPQQPVRPPVEADPADAETADVEAADTEPADAEPADAEPADAEPADAEAADAEAADVEPADVEPADVEPPEIAPPLALGPATRADFRLESTTPDVLLEMDTPGSTPIAGGATTSPAAAPNRPQRTNRPAQRPQRTAIAALQPAPDAAASAMLPDRGIDEERAWLRRTLGPDYGTLANEVSRVLSMHPGFQAGSTAEALTDAVAVRLHLTGHGAGIDRALRTATVGPHVPFGRCVVSGLGRLPSHRGPTVFAADPTPDELELYRERNLVTEWGFLHALTSPCTRQTGSTDVLIWSMTARRTRLLEPDECRTEDRVLFVPGTSFKVLRLDPPSAAKRGLILLRELSAGEIDASGRVDSGPVSLDDVATSSLDGQLERWQPAPRVPEAAAGRFGALPGLTTRDER